MLLVKKIVLALAVAVSIYSATTNAGTTLLAKECSLGLLPFGTSMIDNAKKQAIIEAYEGKGYFVSVLASMNEVDGVEFISDASVECMPNYFGIGATTTVRLVETATNKIVARTSSPLVIDLWTCKIDLFKAIADLPRCEIK